MNPDLRRVGLFALHFAILFPLFLWLYGRALPSYQELVVGLANPVLGSLSPGMHLALEPDGGWKASLLSPTGEATPLYGMHPDALDVLYLNLALVPALLLATPLPPAARLRLLAVGLLLLVGFHVLTVTGLVRTWWCLHLDPQRFLCQWIRGGLKVSGQLFGILEWALLTWGTWLPAAPSAAPRGEAARAATAAGRRRS